MGCGLSVPSIVENIGGFGMVHTAFADVLDNEIVHAETGGVCIVPQLVGSSVYSINEEGDCGKDFCRGNVAVTQEERVKVSILLWWEA